MAQDGTLSLRATKNNRIGHNGEKVHGVLGSEAYVGVRFNAPLSTVPSSSPGTTTCFI